MGQLPQIFDGDRADAKHFVMDLQTYVDFNRHCANILDHCDKVCFALTLIQGQNVRGWKLKMVAWVARQYNDIITWNDFLHQFRE